MAMKYQSGQIVFIQGKYRAKIMRVGKSCVDAIPLEGILERERGKVFTYARDLIKKEKEVVKK